MAAIAWSDVTAHDGSLSALTDTTVRADILAYVNGTLNVSKFGGEASIKTRLARIYLACHMGELWRRRNDPTADDAEVASETISGESIAISYARDASADSLKETTPGRAFLSITKSAKVPIIPGC